MKLGISIVALVALSACSSGNRVERFDTNPMVRLSSGPINTACLNSDRRARSRSLCGCIQSVADASLTGSDQRKAARFFKDPQKAHDVWMSQRPSDDAFWDRYKAFAARSERSCRGA